MSNSTTDAARATQGTIRNVIPASEETAQAHCHNQAINSRYTLITFLPKNLFEQFHRPLNLYFLLVSILQFIPAIAPVNPLSTLLPLLFAFTLTAVKEGYDDVLRHREDKEYNGRLRQVLRNGAWISTPGEDICVGDVIKVKQDEDIPCDLVVFAGPPDCEQTAHIRTDNLDGEIDLKPRDVIDLRGNSDGQASSAMNLTTETPLTAIEETLHSCKIVCPPPCASLSSFEARVDFRGAHVSLGIDHLLPQSCLLKNTHEVIGVAVYTGNETKCGMNKRPAPVKWAKIDQDVSKYSKIIFGFQMCVAFVFGMVGYATNRKLPEKYWYLHASSTSQDGVSFIIFPLRFFLLTSVMIPISFKFVVDMSKFFVAMILHWDLRMYDDERGEGVHVKNSSIVEDLGQVEYIMTDKTGTMTQNVMNLRGCSVHGERLIWNRAAAIPRDEHWDAFTTALSICNTISIEGITDDAASPTTKQNEGGSRNLVYAAVSPDEEALCRGVRGKGVELVERTKNHVKVLFHGKEVEYVVHHVFPFSSEKKCMSIVVQEQSTGIIKMICKGADDKVMGLLTNPTSREAYQCKEHLKEFANMGLRTLVFGERTMSEKELENLLEEHRTASYSIHERAEKLDAVRSQFECSFSLVGASAIEDKLQEEIHDVLTDFISANVRVWMLTGDKIETAQQIALSCGLMRTTDEKIHVHGELWRDVLTNAVKPKPFVANVPMGSLNHRSGAYGKTEETSSVGSAATSAHSEDGLVGLSSPAVTPGQAVNYDSFSDGSTSQPHTHRTVLGDDTHTGTVMVVEGGNTLDKILSTPELASHFREVAMACKSVICARVTPSQKAQVTELVTGSGRLTLAIGDGGNDVSMIQSAHVGVGIVGKEGQQAARAADFSITKFKYLAQLMFVHGHMSYKRTCYVVQYSFYKSMLISFIQLAFNATMTLWSGVSFWDSMSLTAWNGAYTLPPILFFCLDRCAPRSTLEQNPVLYRLSQRGYGQTMRSFFGFIFRGVSQSVASLIMVSLIFSGSFISSEGGYTATQETAFTVTYSALVLLQFFTVIVESGSITGINGALIVAMPFCYLAMTSTYSAIPKLGYYGVFAKTFNNSYFFGAILMVAVLFLPHFAYEAVRLNMFPNALDILRKSTVLRLMASGRAHVLQRFRHGPISSRCPPVLQPIQEKLLLAYVWLVNKEESTLPSSEGIFMS